MRDVETLDWFTGRPLVMPMGIVELGIDGLEAPDLPRAHRRHLPHRPGRPSTARACRCRSWAPPTTCSPAGDRHRPVGLRRRREPLDLPDGAHDPAHRRSRHRARHRPAGAAVGGRRRRRDPPTARWSTPTGPRPRPRHGGHRPGRTSVDVTVPKADDAFWLVLGQSYNQGWHATADGRDLGPPTLVNGYANGWEGSRRHRHRAARAEWTPQQVVWGMIWHVARLRGPGVLVLAAATPGRGRQPTPTMTPGCRSTQRPSMPLAVPGRRSVLPLHRPHPVAVRPGGHHGRRPVVGRLGRGHRRPGPRPLAAAGTLRVPRSRPLLTVGGPACSSAG